MTTQIRFTKTPEIQKILDVLRQKFVGLSEVEVLKISLSNFFRAQEYYEDRLTPAEEASIAISMKEIDEGDFEGPFDTAEEFISSLKK